VDQALEPHFSSFRANFGFITQSGPTPKAKQRRLNSTMDGSKNALKKIIKTVKITINLSLYLLVSL
jgi:hypothetical protein